MFLYKNPSTEYRYPIPVRESRWTNALYQVSYFCLSTHTNHGFGLSVEPCGDSYPSLLDPSLLISPHKHSRYCITCPYTSLPPASSIVEFLVFSAEKGSENPLPPKGKSRLLIGPSPASYLSTLTETHSLPRIWDHQSVSYVPDTGSFWQCWWLISFQLLLEFIWSESEIQQPIEKFFRIWPGCGIEPAPFFYLGFASGELLFKMRTQVFSYFFK